MKKRLHVNNTIKAIGSKEIKSNFESHLLSGFESYFPGAIEVIRDEELEIFVNDIPLIENIIDFINETGESPLGVDWIHEYANEKNYVEQIIPFKVGQGQKQYVSPECR